MKFFLTLNRENSVAFSPFRETDKLGSNVTSYLSPSLDLLTIQIIMERLQQQTFTDLWFKRSGRKEKNFKIKILKILDSLGRNKEFVWENVAPSFRKVQNQEKKQKIFFSQLVLGRQLSSSDFRKLALELKVDFKTIIEWAHYNVEQGNAQWIPAVQPQGMSWQCQRCGARDVEEWPGLHGLVATCRSCESMGICTSLDALYRDYRCLYREDSEIFFQPHRTLTEAQVLASKQVLEFMQDSAAEKALLWAACGAGKTEVCFPAAAWALKEGKSVLFAAPRQDVIHDVAPRLKRDFPSFPLQVLTGTVSVKFQKGRMVLATTHQVLRFWRAFDVIFLDEMDAFPYYGNEALQWGLNHALRQGGKILYLTATPSPEGLKAVRQEKMRLIRLPARHHRRPLPVPIWEKADDFIAPDNGGDGRNKIFLLLEYLREQGRVLVFIPKISWLYPCIACFQHRFPSWRVDGSYSADPGRTDKIERLRQGEFDIFVSTTILERGITVSGIQVVVLAADHFVYDERALVQMAGRAGRTQESPEGWIIFVSRQRTSAMKKAIKWIEEQNRMALESGLIERGREKEWEFGKLLRKKQLK